MGELFLFFCSPLLGARCSTTTHSLTRKKGSILALLSDNSPNLFVLKWMKLSVRKGCSGREWIEGEGKKRNA